MSRLLAVLLSGLLIVLFFAHSTTPSKAAIEGSSTLYFVERGDTLWGIAERFAPPNMDLREYVFRLRRLNGLQHTAIIEPGQRIKLLLP